VKKELIRILKCPRCGCGEFSFEGMPGGEQEAGKTAEIRSGRLSCGSCSEKFTVDEGILNLLYNPAEDITRQQKVICGADMDSRSEGGGFEINRANIQLYRKQFLALPEGDGSKLYKSVAFRNTASLASHYRAFTEKLALTGKEKLLELGADSCWSVSGFAKLGCDCVALDISHHLIVSDLYMREYNIYFERVIADMSRLPFRDESFDVVFCSQTLHHSMNLQETLREINRVLKPGGKLALFSEPALGILFAWRKKFYGWEARKLGIIERAYTLYEWLGFLKKAGFAPELYFSIHQRYAGIKKYLFLLRNRLVGRVLSKSRIYPLLVLEPYKADIIAGKKGNNASGRKAWNYYFI
jgi:ubiquinone/menaquinone biosynthesis C-methylase UbiE/uncharacterized protein YbaR (Trm112 family)